MHNAKLTKNLCVGEKSTVKSENKSLMLKINSLDWFTLNTD